MNDTRFFSIKLALLCLPLVWGCSSGTGDEGPALVPVTGTITGNGEPLANISVSFNPFGDQPGRSAYGLTDAAGKYSLTYVDGREGCPSGKFRVTTSKFALPDGSPFPADFDMSIASSEGVEHMPPNYSDSAKTELVADVPAEGGTIDFDLKLKNKK